MDDSLKEGDSEIPEEWKKLLNRSEIKKVGIETMEKWMNHPKKKLFINWGGNSVEYGSTMLNFALFYNRLDIAKLLLENGADIIVANKEKWTVLMSASDCGHTEIVEILLNQGADINVVDKHGWTALMLASYNGHKDTVKLLLEKDADITMTNKDGNTVLMIACQRAHSDIVEILLEKGADVTIANIDGRTAFTDAYYRGCVTVVDVLLEKAPLKDIIHDVVKYSRFAEKFLELYRERREIVDWLDRDGRTVRQVACKECREAILFMGQYDLDDQPIYESPTCKIYSALDYGGREEHSLKQPRLVVMKFMEKKIHFLNEIRSRRNDDGNPRFSSEFVTPDLASYSADKDPEYAEACKTWKTYGNETNLLPDHCIVMPRGERSLLEAMNAENLTAKHKGHQRRETLLSLCKVFSYLHDKGYVHGDIKPHNVVRHMADNLSWKAIDFDACTQIGDAVGLKLTTGSAPPEMLKVVKGGEADTESVVLRQPHGGLDESHLVMADPSFDVWSYGMLMYQLVTGRSFFHTDLQGNLDVVGLGELAGLTQSDIHKKLEVVDDVNARVLLSRILRLDPKERPTMPEVGLDYYFHPSESPHGRKAEFFGNHAFDAASKDNQFSFDSNQTNSPEKNDDASESIKKMEHFLASKSEFSYFKLRDEDKDWSDKLLNSEIETFQFDELGGMCEKLTFIDGDTIYQSSFLRSLLSANGPDYFMGFLVEYFGLYKIMHDAHEVCQGIKANLVSDVKDLKNVFIKLFVRGKGLNDVVRGTLFCNSIDQFKYVGMQLKEKHGHNVHIKPPKKEVGAWPIPKMLIYGNRRFHGRCMSVEIQFSTVYIHLATHASNNHLVYEAIRESTGFLGDKDQDFQKFLLALNEHFIDTEGFLQSHQSVQDSRFEIVVERSTEEGNGNKHSVFRESGKEFATKATGFITSGLILCGAQLFRFMPPTDRFQKFSQSSFVVNNSLTLLSSHSYWSEESYNLEGNKVEVIVSFKGRGLVIAGIATEKCLHGTVPRAGGGTRCSVHVGRSKFVVRKDGIEQARREKKLPDQERAKISFEVKGGVLSVSFVGSEIDELVQIIIPQEQRYYLYMRAPPGVHDVKYHDINVHKC